MRHTRLGPSSWDRWVRCPGSVVASELVPDETSWEAAEGTAFHHMIASCVIHGIDPNYWVGYGIQVEQHWIEFDQEMADVCRDGLEIIERLMDDSDWTVRVEEEVDISKWAGPEQIGNADIIAWSAVERHIIVFDWKYGKGIPVYPHSSYQVRGYALGAWSSFIFSDFLLSDFQGDPSDIRVDLMIEQPRIPSAGGTYQTTMGNLLVFGERVIAARERVEAGRHNLNELEFNPGEKQCEFCLVRASCKAHADWILSSMSLEFEDLDKVNPLENLPFELTPERRTAVLRMWPNVKKWFDDMHASAYHDANMGRSVPGLKLVEGRRSRRKWKEDFLSFGIVRTRLVEEVGEEHAETQPVPISVAAAEKIMGKKRFAAAMLEMVQYGKSKLVLVPDDDKREPVGSIVEEFDVLV